MPLRILIAAGGTGGHIFPAIALGEALAAHHPETRFDYLCGERPLERELYASQGIEPIVFPARQLGTGLVSRAAGLWAAAANTWRAWRLVRSGGYDVVIGMGGYVTGPAVLGAVLARRATAVHESNSVPGKTNLMLAPLVDLSAVHFAATGGRWRARRTERVGMPLRAGIFGADRAEAIRHFGLDPARRTLLVIGGSQGARFLYETLMTGLPQLDTPAHADLQVLWSTGTANLEMLSARLRAAAPRHISVRLEPFIHRMDLALAAADLAVARAGASTGAELVSCGITTLFIPYPHAIHDHQTANAREFVAAGAGEMFGERELTPELFAGTITRMLAATPAGHRFTPREDLDSRGAARTLARLLHDLPGR